MIDHIYYEIRKDYPTTGVLKLMLPVGILQVDAHYQEGLPDYWGIETFFKTLAREKNAVFDQEGLPDYWGIETQKEKYHHPAQVI